jgi:hypothetical protein
MSYDEGSPNRYPHATIYSCRQGLFLQLNLLQSDITQVQALLWTYFRWLWFDRAYYLVTHIMSSLASFVVLLSQWAGCCWNLHRTARSNPWSTCAMCITVHVLLPVGWEICWWPQPVFILLAHVHRSCRACSPRRSSPRTGIARNRGARGPWLARSFLGPATAPPHSQGGPAGASRQSVVEKDLTKINFVFPGTFPTEDWHVKSFPRISDPREIIGF